MAFATASASASASSPMLDGLFEVLKALVLKKLTPENQKQIADRETEFVVFFMSFIPDFKMYCRVKLGDPDIIPYDGQFDEKNVKEYDAIIEHFGADKILKLFGFS